MTAILDIQQINNGLLPKFGQVFIGAVNTDPVTNPITVFSDNEQTQALITPLSLDFNGRPLDPATGEVVTLYINTSYSIQWLDKDGNALLPDFINVEITAGVSSVGAGTNLNNSGTVSDPVINLDLAITGVSVNSVTLTNAGLNTNFLNEAGTYSVPPSLGQVDSVVSGTNITVDATDPINPIVNLNASITGVSVNGVTLSNVGLATNFLNETGVYSTPSDTNIGNSDFSITGQSRQVTVAQSFSLQLLAFGTGSDTSLVDVLNDQARIRSFDGTDESVLNISNSGMVITDNIKSLGLVYLNDYSGNYVPRSLVDKNYVDTLPFLPLSGGTVTGDLILSSVTNPFRVNALTQTQEDVVTQDFDGQFLYNSTTDSMRFREFLGGDFKYASPATANIIRVRQLSDLPTPVSANITIPANTLVLVEDNIDISTNIITMGISTTIQGSGSVSSSITGSNSGTVVTCSAAGFCKISDIVLSSSISNNALIVNGGATMLLQSVIFGNSSFMRLETHTSVDMRLCAFPASARLLVLEDSTNGILLINECLFEQTTATSSLFFDATSVVNVRINSTQFDTFTGGIGIVQNGAATILSGFINEGSITGTGSATLGFDQTSDEWEINGVGGSLGLDDSANQAISSVTSTNGITGTEVTISAIDTWTDVADAGSTLVWSLASGAQKYTQSSTINGELIYNGVVAKGQKLGGNILLTGVSGGGTNLLEIGVSINGAAPTSSIKAVVVNNAFISVGLPKIPISLITTDKPKIQVKNITDSDNITVISGELIASF